MYRQIISLYQQYSHYIMSVNLDQFQQYAKLVAMIIVGWVSLSCGRDCDLWPCGWILAVAARPLSLYGSEHMSSQQSSRGLLDGVTVETIHKKVLRGGITLNINRDILVRLRQANTIRTKFVGNQMLGFTN